MGWSFYGDEGLEREVRAALAEEAVRWPTTIVEWDADGASDALDTAKRAGHAVVAIVGDDEGEVSALRASADAVVRRSASPEALRLHVRRAIARARGPWLERLLEMVNDSVEITDPEATLLDVNPAFERVTGYSRESALGRTPGELFRTGNQDENHYEGIGETVEAGKIWSGQFTAKRQDGSLSFQTVAIAAAYDSSRRVVGHIAVKRDTTRDDLAWSALENAEDRHRHVLEQASDAVFVHDIDGAIADVNPAACRLLGLSREALVEVPIFAHDLNRDASELQVLYRSLGAEALEVEAQWNNHEGKTLDLVLSLTRTRVSGTELYITFARDVTLRREAQRRLESLNEELEKKVEKRTRDLRRALAQRAAVLNHLSDGIISVDARRRIELWNPAMADLLGGISPHLLGGSLSEVSPPLAEIVAECLSLDAPTTREMVLPDGRVLEVHAAPIHVDELRVRRITLGAVVAVRDVTRARELDRLKTDFIATVSHELRTPLTSVLGFAMLARRKLQKRVAPAVDPEDGKAVGALSTVERNLEIIAREGKRLSNLIDDVLDISKMEAGGIEWHTDTVEPHALIDEAIEVTSGLFSSDDVVCSRGGDPIVGVLEVDRQRLLQVLINLISNASKFTREGTVTLAAVPHPEGVLFTVTDTGSGVPLSQRERIFEKFKQAEDTLTDKPRGTGLGLPICRRIVEHHGGRIWVEDAPVQGSRFCFTLPSHARSSVDETTAQELVTQMGDALEPHLRRPAEILVVDDDAGVRELLRQTLEDEGHSVRTAVDGIAAVAAVREAQPDLVILDVLMPGLTGYDVAAMLRADPSTEELPILILSVVSDRARHESLGIDRYLTKPLQQNELLRALDELTAKMSPDRAWVVMSYAEDD